MEVPLNEEQINKELQEIQEQIKETEEFLNLLELYKDYQDFDRVVSSFEIQKEELQKPKTESYKTKLPNLDNLTDGFRKGNLIVLSGVTASGKTTFAQTLLKNFIEQNIKCLFFTYEVPNEEFIKKFGIEIPLFYLPRRYKKSKMLWLEQRIVEAIAKYDIKIVFIDHLHFLVDMEMIGKIGNVSLLIGGIMREIKQIAIKYNLVIFLIAHFKKVKLNEDEMPDIDGLRDSSFVGQESDYVLIISRKKSEDKKNWIDEANLFICKNRWNGKTGFVELVCRDNLFKEVEQIYDESGIQA